MIEKIFGTLIMAFAIFWFIGGPVLLIMVIKNVQQQQKDIETLKTTIETMIKMGYAPTREPPKPPPKYAAGDEMDDIHTGTPFQF